MDKIIFATVLVLFPFGQLFKIGFLNAFDITVFFLAIITLFKKPKYPNWYKYFVNFLLFCLFGLVANYLLFTDTSLLYLIRLWSYSMIAVYVWNHQKKLLSIRYSLLAISLASVMLGFIQYFLYPDFRALAEFGWDDHYLRMLGTFFDPAFLGLIMVLGLIIAVYKKNNLVVNFLAFSILLTYSRVSIFLSFLILLWNKKFFAIALMLLTFILLPKNIGEGTTITRTASGINKLQNYKESFEIIKTSPLYGIGFNNLCSYKGTDPKSHSCSGLDSSILFLLATTGAVGAMLLLYTISLMPQGLELKASFIVILLHSLFTNSLFYPHTMFWLFCLVGLSGKVNIERS